MYSCFQALKAKMDDDIAIERENVTKFLGVLIDENLPWKQHANYVNTKISKSIGILYKSRGIVKQPLLKPWNMNTFFRNILEI